MIQVTRLDGSRLYVNAELVEFVESTPDTVLSLTTGRKIIVRESGETVVEAIMSYKQRLQAHEPVVGQRYPHSARNAGQTLAAEE